MTLSAHDCQGPCKGKGLHASAFGGSLGSRIKNKKQREERGTFMCLACMPLQAQTAPRPPPPPPPQPTVAAAPAAAPAPRAAARPQPRPRPQPQPQPPGPQPQEEPGPGPATQAAFHAGDVAAGMPPAEPMPAWRAANIDEANRRIYRDRDEARQQVQQLEAKLEEVRPDPPPLPLPCRRITPTPTPCVCLCRL